MAEKTATRKKGSLKKILEGKNVFVDFEWTYNRDNKNKAYRNLNPDSTSRSYILQEIERDFSFYSQEDKAGVAEWQKLKDSGATTPGGKPIAFEKDNKKFIVISEIFNGDQKTETVLNKQWYNRNLKDIAPDFTPQNIRNWDELQKQLSIYQKGDSSEVFETLENDRISAIKQDNQDSRGRSISGIEDGIGFKKNAPNEKETIEEDPTKDEENNLVNVTLNDNPNLVSRKSNLGKSDLYYPIDMDISNMDYLLIKIVNYKPAGSGFIRGRGENRSALLGLIPTEDIVPSPSNLNPDGSINNYTKEERDFIFLPIPSNIQDGNSVSFAENSLDAFSAGLASFAGGSIDELTGAVSEFQKSGKVPENMKQKFENAFGGLGPSVQEILKKSLLAQAANLTGISNASFQSLLARESGSILNPNKELLFNGVSLRTFRFSFKLTPRSKDEGIAVKQIIRSLKSNMAPKIVGSSEGNVDPNPDNQRSGQFLRTPNVFELQYMKGRERHPFLNYFKTCALTDMSVKYTGENIYSTYNEGTPVSMIMDLTFKELEPVYDIDYSEDNDQETKSVGY